MLIEIKYHSYPKEKIDKAFKDLPEIKKLTIVKKRPPLNQWRGRVNNS